MPDAYPAATLWRRELAAGVRTVRTVDTLWRAAAWERAGEVALSEGRRSHCLERARQIVGEAAAKKRGAA
jgi:hypothetical protein